MQALHPFHNLAPAVFVGRQSKDYLPFHTITPVTAGLMFAKIHKTHLAFSRSRQGSL